MKILEAIDVFSPAAGGSANVAGHLSQAMSWHGHEVTVYTSDLRLEEDYVNSFSGVKVRAFHSYFSPGGKPLLMYGMPNRAKKELRDFDIIHLHNYPTLTNAVICRYAREYRIPYLLQAHGSLATYFQKGFIKRVYDRLWGKNILKGAARVIAVAPLEAETYRSMGVAPEKIEIVPNGIDAAEFRDLPPRGEFCNKYGLQNQKIVLYLGRIHATKGLDILAGAFAGLARERADARLVIAGPDDGYLPALRNLIKKLQIEERTLCTGPLYGTAKLQALCDTDVFVLPSSYEIFGIAALEACLCGAPVIVTERCGIAPEITPDLGQVIGYDKSELKSALLKALAALRAEGVSLEKRRQALLARFSWDRLAEQVETIYRDAIEGNKPEESA